MHGRCGGTWTHLDGTPDRRACRGSTSPHGRSHSPTSSSNASLDVVGVNERVSVGFKRFAAFERLLARAAVHAPAFSPRVLHTFEPDVARVAGEAFGDGVLALSALRAIHAAPRQQAGEMRDADAEHLPCQDVIDPLFNVWNLGRQSLGKPASDLAQEHTRLRDRVEEPYRLVGPEVR